MYSIKTDTRQQAAIHIKLSGFMSLAEVAEFGRAQQAAVIAMGSPNGGHLVLCETSDAFLQSQDVVRAFQNLIANTPRPSRAMAVVTGASLTRMQVRRILIHPNSKMFSTREEARAWLLQTAPRS